MNEKPLERLNYYNGQRLQAADLKLEQDYHIRVRRWLNRSLYSAGIAEGLAVYAIKGQPRVRVTPGLAIDHLGREIILLEEAVVDVVNGYHGGGPYLSIRYREAVLGKDEESCNANGHCERPAWGGPARILAEPVLELSTSVPNEASGRIPLAALRMGSECTSIDAVDLGVRRYIGEGSANKVKQYALEGVRDVAALPSPSGGAPVLVKGTVIFHVRGRQPSAVTLFLKGREVSRLHYTEMGTHTHGLTIAGGTGNPTTSIQHHHANSSLRADSDAGSAHNHSLTARRGYIGRNEGSPGGAAFFLIERDWGVQLGFDTQSGPAGDFFDWVGNNIGQLLGAMPVEAPEKDAAVLDILGPTGGTIGGGTHAHTISGDTANANIDLNHVHTLSGSGTSNSAGALDSQNASVVARTDEALHHFHGLKIAVDGTDHTRGILQQIAAAVAPDVTTFWSVIGNGNADHPIVDPRFDAVAVRIDFLPGVSLGEGEHRIEFSVDLLDGAANGGVVQYNLYVE